MLNKTFIPLTNAVYISGAENLTALPSEATEAITNIINLNYPILIGDRDGLDSLIQAYLKSLEYSYDQVFIYSKRFPKNNLGFNQIRVLYAKNEAEVQEIMATEASYGLAIIQDEADLTVFNQYSLPTKIIYVNEEEKPTPPPQKPRFDLYHIKEYLKPNEQQIVLEECREVVTDAPLFTPTMSSGAKFKYQMTNSGLVGWVSDKQGYRYTSTHPVTGRAWPPIPDFLKSKILEAVKDIDSEYIPETCLMNFYQSEGKLGLHQDNSEPNKTAPIVSFSLGDLAIFLLQTENKINEYKLESGDLVILEGKNRMAYHGIKHILPNTSSLLKNGGRINLTARQVYETGTQPIIEIKTAFFTGHRTIEDNPLNINAINHLIDYALNLGIKEFYTGMAMGLDLLAGEQLIKRNLPFIAAIPCENQSEKWPIYWQEKWTYVRSQATSEIVLYDTYNDHCLNDRNLYMIRNSKLGLAVYDGSSGGTQNAINDALKANLIVYSFNPFTQEYTEFNPLFNSQI